MGIDYSAPLLQRMRGIGSRLGITRPMLGWYRRLRGSGYEERFGREILARIRPGDVVWDVGANVGYFTVRFSERAGASGRVVAFEPSPTTFGVLAERCAALENVELFEQALGDADGHAQFLESDTVADPTNGLVGTGRFGTEVTVQVRRGDAVAASRPELAPSAIKIDVEGFEPEVLDGLAETLRSPGLHDVFVEVHFQILAARGLGQAPARISALLESNGFQVVWVDPSHLIASR